VKDPEEKKREGSETIFLLASFFEFSFDYYSVPDQFYSLGGHWYAAEFGAFHFGVVELVPLWQTFLANFMENSYSGLRPGESVKGFIFTKVERRLIHR
jgi:hypothetical protein